MSDSSRNAYKRPLVIALVALILIGAWWWRRTRPTPAALYEVSAREVVEVYVVAGVTRAGQESQVGAGAPGRVERLRAQPGAQVRSGDVLIELSPMDAQLAVEQARARVRVAKGELKRLRVQATPAQRRSADARIKRAKAEVETAERELKRTRALARDGLASPSELDRAISALRLRKSDLTLARAQRGELTEKPRSGDMEMARGRLAEAEAMLKARLASLGDTRIHAPFDGLVVRTLVTQGEYARAGQGLLVLAQQGQMEISTEIQEEYLGKLRVGMPVTCTLAAWPDRKLTGTVRRVGPEVDEARGVVQVRVSVPGLPPQTLPGLSADVAFQLQRLPDALAVPRRAVAQDSGAAVFVVSRGVARRTPVTVLAEGEEFLAVKGVARGVTVLADATRAQDGERVVATSREQKPAPGAKAAPQ